MNREREGERERGREGEREDVSGKKGEGEIDRNIALHCIVEGMH